ncbi:MAG: hypothetical protein RSF33_08580, partial [Hydrogenoanaerobacterium sp.]
MAVSDWVYSNGECTRGSDVLTFKKVFDTDTKTATLQISITSNGNDYGVVSCSLLNLEADLKKIATHGIFFDVKDSYAVKKIISTEFQNIPEEYSKGKSDEVKSLYAMFCDRIADILAIQNDKMAAVSGKTDSEISAAKAKCEETLIVKPNLYCFPDAEFAKEIHGSITNMSEKQIRIEFANAGYTDCNPARTDKMIKNSNNDPVRCVAFYRKSV